MKYYQHFWTKIQQITNKFHVSFPTSTPLQLKHPILLKQDNNVAFNYLTHHCGIHWKIVQYLLNRRLIISGKTKGHTPVIAFVQRVPANKKIARHKQFIDTQYRNTLIDDIALSKGHQAPQGLQDEKPVGVDYLFLYKTQYSYHKNHHKVQLLSKNLLKGNNGYAEYRIYKNSTFSIKTTPPVHQSVLVITPVEAVCYLQAHLTQHRQAQHINIVVTFDNYLRSLYSFKYNYQKLQKQQIRISPSHRLRSQSIISKYNINSSAKNVKIIYPQTDAQHLLKSWQALVQDQAFNQKMILNPTKVLSTKANNILINNGVLKELGIYNARCFGLMLDSLAQSFQNKITKKYEPLNRSNIRIQEYMVSKSHLNKRSQHFIKQYLFYIGKQYKPTTVNRWLQNSYHAMYKQANPLLSMPTVKYINTFQYHRTKEIIKSLKQQGQEVMRREIHQHTRHNNRHKLIRNNKININQHSAHHSRTGSLQTQKQYNQQLERK